MVCAAREPGGHGGWGVLWAGGGGRCVLKNGRARPKHPPLTPIFHPPLQMPKQKAVCACILPNFWRPTTSPDFIGNAVLFHALWRVEIGWAKFGQKGVDLFHTLENDDKVFCLLCDLPLSNGKSLGCCSFHGGDPLNANSSSSARAYRPCRTAACAPIGPAELVHAKSGIFSSAIATPATGITKPTFFSKPTPESQATEATDSTAPFGPSQGL